MKLIGKGGYQGTKVYEYEIVPRSLSDNSVSVTVPNMGYTGAQLRSVPVVAYAGAALAKGKDYIVTYGQKHRGRNGKRGNRRLYAVCAGTQGEETIRNIKKRRPKRFLFGTSFFLQKL